MRKRRWSHYAAPAAFLLAVTIAVLAVRSALDTGASPTGTTALSPPPTRSAATTTTRRTTTRATAAPRFYTVVAGDTFEVVSRKTGVAVVRIAALNPDADSNALFIGQRLRLR